MMVVFIIINKKGKRIRLMDGTISPAFEFPSQALNYIVKRLNNSSAVTLKKVGINPKKELQGLLKQSINFFSSKKYIKKTLEKIDKLER